MKQEPIQWRDKSKNQKENINSDCLGKYLSLIPQIAPHPLNGFPISDEYAKGITQNAVLRLTSGFKCVWRTTVKVC
jgi:hypothetical protein